MHQRRYVERIIDLMDPGKNVLLNISYAEAAEHVASGNAEVGTTNKIWTLETGTTRS